MMKNINIFKQLFLVLPMLTILYTNACAVIADTSSTKFSIKEEDWRKKREVALNVTSLLHNFVPFNLGDVDPGITGIRFKYYDKKYAFRTSFGTSIASNISTNSLTRDFFYFSAGYERRRIVANRWAYTSGWDFFTSRGIIAEEPEESLVGFSKHYGIEYYINNKCFVGTDAQILLGVGSVAAFRFIYPNSVYFNIRL
jgi:hypothetical protein